MFVSKDDDVDLAWTKNQTNKKQMKFCLLSIYKLVDNPYITKCVLIRLLYVGKSTSIMHKQDKFNKTLEAKSLLKISLLTKTNQNWIVKGRPRITRTPGCSEYWVRIKTNISFPQGNTFIDSLLCKSSDLRRLHYFIQDVRMYTEVNSVICWCIKSVNMLDWLINCLLPLSSGQYCRHIQVGYKLKPFNQ